MNWKKLSKRIPNKVQVAHKTFFEVLWSPEIVGGEDCYGMCRFDPNQIVLLQGMTPKNATTTYLHEVIHAISDTHGIGLTEKQVRQIEKVLHYILKPGNILKEE